jgi:hypothetical protein
MSHFIDGIVAFGIIAVFVFCGRRKKIYRQIRFPVLPPLPITEVETTVVDAQFVSTPPDISRPREVV